MMGEYDAGYENCIDAMVRQMEDMQYSIDCLHAENAKLRELVRDYERCSVHADCGLCEYDGKLSTHCPLSPCFPDADELRELVACEENGYVCGGHKFDERAEKLGVKS